MSHRLEQVSELIRQEVAILLLTEVEFPKDCLVTIIKVTVSKDLRHAKVFISVMPTKYIGKALNNLKKNVGHLQYLLNKKLTMKPLPRLAFGIDQTEAQAADLDALLDQIKKTS